MGASATILSVALTDMNLHTSMAFWEVDDHDKFELEKSYFNPTTFWYKRDCL